MTARERIKLRTEQRIAEIKEKERLAQLAAEEQAAAAAEEEKQKELLSRSLGRSTLSISIAGSNNNIGGISRASSEMSLPIGTPKTPANATNNPLASPLKTPKGSRPNSHQGERTNEMKAIEEVSSVDSGSLASSNQSSVKSPKLHTPKTPSKMKKTGSLLKAVGSPSKKRSIAFQDGGIADVATVHGSDSESVERLLSLLAEPSSSIDTLDAIGNNTSPKDQRPLSKKSPVKPSRLDDRSYVDDSLNSSYAPASPRAIFLSGCLKHGLPPRAQVMLRKRLSSSINLAHMGIGNQMAMVLAEALPTLPYLQAINLNDNNLEGAFFAAVVLVSFHL
jgi:hypothetical protein